MTERMEIIPKRNSLTGKLEFHQRNIDTGEWSIRLTIKEYAFWHEYFRQREQEKAYYKKKAAERLAEVKRTIKRPVEDAARAIGLRATMAKDWDIGYSGPRYDIWRVRISGDWLNEILEKWDVDHCELFTNRNLDYLKRNLERMTEEGRALLNRLDGIILALNKVAGDWKLIATYKKNRSPKHKPQTMKGKAK